MSDATGLEARLQQLLAKRGQELVRGLVEEVTNLNREIVMLRRELTALSDYQNSRDRWLVLDQTRQVARLPRSATIEPDQLLRPRDGFYPAEYTSAGVPFRWTGPSTQFFFDVFVDRSHGADLKLEVLNCIDVERQIGLMLLADGEAVPLEVEPVGLTGFTASAFLPAQADGRATNLVFVLPAVLPPEGSKDERLLGVAFGRLTVTARPDMIA
jgi:hypothetical protein